MSTEEQAWKKLEEIDSSLAIIVQTPDKEYHVLDLETVDWQDPPLLAGGFTVLNCTDDGYGFYRLDFEKVKITTVEDLETLIELQEEHKDAFSLFVSNYPQDLISFENFEKYYVGFYETYEAYGEEQLRNYLQENCEGFEQIESYITFKGDRYVTDSSGYLKIYESIEYDYPDLSQPTPVGYHFFRG